MCALWREATIFRFCFFFRCLIALVIALDCLQMTQYIRRICTNVKWGRGILCKSSVSSVQCFCCFRVLLSMLDWQLAVDCFVKVCA